MQARTEEQKMLTNEKIKRKLNHHVQDFSTNSPAGRRVTYERSLEISAIAHVCLWIVLVGASV